MELQKRIFLEIRKLEGSIITSSQETKKPSGLYDFLGIYHPHIFFLIEYDIK